MYFWIISLSVIIGGFFHLAGVGAFIITIIIFYWAGRVHRKVKDRIVERKRRKRHDKD